MACLDAGFIPLARLNSDHLRNACQPFHVAVERPDGVAVRHVMIHGTRERFDDDVYFVRQTVKALLWSRGGFRVLLAGDGAVCQAVAAIFAPGGRGSFDADFMAGIYGRPFSVERTDRVPEPWDSPRPAGGHTDGCRIGFDAGGSDRKAVAMIDGKVVYAEAVPWSPKSARLLACHADGIMAGLRSAAAHLPRVDAVGVSTAGICVEDRVMRSVLFEKVPRSEFDPAIYQSIVACMFGAVPCAVINDGDASALAGAAALGETDVLGIAMGTSLAAGYVDSGGRVTGWLNELAFVPVDASPDAPVDPWSADRGCGASYLSQDGVIRLADLTRIELDSYLSPAQKLSAVQELAERGDPRALAVFDTVGMYLAHALALYRELYPFRHVVLMGRVTSGKGGEQILAQCRAILASEYPDVAQSAALHLPGEAKRLTGQAIAAATLPALY